MRIQNLKLTELISYLVIILLANLIYMKVYKTGFAGYLIASAKSLGLFLSAAGYRSNIIPLFS